MNKDCQVKVKIVKKSVSVNIAKNKKIKIPYWELDSKKKGPVLLVTAVFHGHEIQGSEVIRRFKEIALKKLHSGKIILFPFVNKPALHNRLPHICCPEDKPNYSVADNRNLFMAWPGKKNGTYTERLAYSLFPVFTAETTHHIDIHCYPVSRGTTVLYSKNDQKSIELVQQTGIRFAESFDHHLPKVKPTLVYWFLTHNRPSIVIELSGQYGMYENEIKRGLQALTNCAKYLKIFSGKQQGLEEKTFLIEGPWRTAKKTSIKAVSSGLFCKADLKTSDFVRKGQLLGYIFDDANLKTTKVLAPVSGYLWVYNCHRKNCDVSLAALHPYVTKGELIAEIVNG